MKDCKVTLPAAASWADASSSKTNPVLRTCVCMCVQRKRVNKSKSCQNIYMCFFGCAVKDVYITEIMYFFCNRPIKDHLVNVVKSLHLCDDLGELC